MSDSLIDTTKLAENLKERVRQEFVNLIPEETWDKFTKETIDSFIKNDLQKVMKEEMANIIRQEIKSYLINLSYLKWENNKQVLDPELTKGLAEMAPAMFIDILKGAISYQLGNMANGMAYTQGKRSND